MLISMTGYGNGNAVRDGVTVSTELRGVNNRFYEFSARLPKYLQPREGELKEIVRKAVGRGKINLSVSIEKEGTGSSPVEINTEAVLGAYRLLDSVRVQTGITAEISLETLFKFSDAFIVENEKALGETEWETVLESLSAALAMFTEMRRKEGGELTDDLRRRVIGMGEAIDRIEAMALGRVEAERIRLQERIAQLLESDKIDPARLEFEIVLLADKMDITEEMVRFRSHVKFFLEALEGAESEGRKLSFLLQEMNREANTISSKSYDTDIAHEVVRIKEELERVREQIQNVE